MSISRMVVSLEEFPDLISAEDPLSWAFDNLCGAGRGSAIGLFNHPERSGVVIRVTDYPDGWFAYVDAVRSFSGDILRHTPVLFDATCVNCVWIGLCERLERIEDRDKEATEWLATARNHFSGHHISRAELNAFRASQPAFEALVAALPRPPTDLRPENFMLRGRNLILNDPWGAKTRDEELRLIRTLAIVQAPPPR